MLWNPETERDQCSARLEPIERKPRYARSVETMKSLTDSYQVEGGRRRIERLRAAYAPAHVGDAEPGSFAPSGLDHLGLLVDGPDLCEVIRDRQRYATRPTGKVQEPRVARQTRLIEEPVQHYAWIGRSVAHIIIRCASEGVGTQVGRQLRHGTPDRMSLQTTGELRIFVPSDEVQRFLSIASYRTGQDVTDPDGHEIEIVYNGIGVFWQN